MISTDCFVSGGEDALLGEFPWAALIGYNASKLEYDLRKKKKVLKHYTEWKCGGTLINSKYVLSAAHCHSKRNKKNQIATVALGENEVGVNPDCPSGHGLKASRDTLAGL